MNRKILGIFAFCVFVGFSMVHTVSAVPRESWLVETTGQGTYTIHGNHISMSTTLPTIILYKEIDYTNDFIVSARVKAKTLGQLGFFFAKSTPIFGSVEKIVFEVYNPQIEGKGFLVARYVNGWTWTVIGTPETDIWYTLTMSVHANPFSITFSVSAKGKLIASITLNDWTNLSFGDLNFVGFECNFGTYIILCAKV